MSELIIGTAGHIDHGKSSLIKALNGFDGDSTKEEKKRGITLDLSYSNLRFEGKNIAFIDVPGHEKLIKHLISAATAFEYVLFVVDINEGLKPQSIEHLRILELLGNKKIILILSKADLCEHKELRENQLIKAIKSFKIELSEVFLSSIYEQKSINKIKKYLFSLNYSEKTSPFTRLFIDRAFSLKGFGSIITASLNEGSLKKGDKLSLLELNKDIKLKNIQVQGENVESVSAPSRVALNLELKTCKRGFILASKGIFKGFKEIDAIIFAKELKNIEYECFIGARKELARLKILSFDEKNSSFFCTLTFKKELFACFKDPLFLLENKRLIGGGKVLNPVSEPLKRAKKLLLLKALLKDDFLKSFELLKSFHKKGFGLLSSYQRFKLSKEEAFSIAKGLENAFIDELCIYDISVFKLIKEEIKKIFLKNPYALISANMLHARLAYPSIALCKEALKAEKGLNYENGRYFQNKFELKSCEKNSLELLYESISKAGFTPKAPYNIYDELCISKEDGDIILKKLCAKGLVIRLKHNIFMDTKAIALLKTQLLGLLEKDFLDVAKLKQYFKISRKYAIAYLEYLDKEKLVINKDGKRFLNFG